jgi:hypothetical protein
VLSSPPGERLSPEGFATRTKADVRSELEEVEALCRGENDLNANRFAAENNDFFERELKDLKFGNNGEAAANDEFLFKEGKHEMAPQSSSSAELTPMQQLQQMPVAQQQHMMAQLQAQAPRGTQVVMTPQGPMAMTPQEMQSYQQQMIAYQEQMMAENGQLQPGSDQNINFLTQGTISEKQAEELKKKNLRQQFHAILIRCDKIE